MSDLKGNQFGSAAEDYGRYRAGFPDSFFYKLTEFLIGLPGQTIVDLGTGTGTLARGFARLGCLVTGLDPDARMIAKSKELDMEFDFEINYIVAKAEQTGLADSSADIVTAGQCWHWFDRPRATAEVYRLLKPKGHVVVAHFDWLPLSGNVVQATEQLILTYKPDWHLAGGDGFHTTWVADLADGAFTDIRTFSYDVTVPYSHEAWRGRVRACNGVIALGEEGSKKFDNDLKKLLKEKYSDEPIPVPHRVFAVIATKPG